MLSERTLGMVGAPLVSVIFPVFNERVEYLNLSLESLVAQTLADFEVVIIDDSTVVETQSVVDEFARRDRRFRVFRSSSSQGLAAALNLGIELARGRYLARADSDDIQHPERLRLQVEFLEANSNIGVVGSAMTKIDAAGAERGVRRYPPTHKDIHRVSCIKTPLCHPAVALRKEVLDRHGGYDPAFRRAEDYELWLRLIGAGVKFANLEEPLVFYRLSDGGKRSRDHWKFNLRAKVRHFSSEYVLLRIVGLIVVGIYSLMPVPLMRRLYESYNRL